MLKTFSSYVLGAFLALLIIAPPIPYSIPLLVNSYHWLYLVCAGTLFGFLLLWHRLNIFLKILIVYLFFSCFVSQAPASSFNSFLLVIFAMYLFIALSKCDYAIVVKFLEAAFWFEICLCVLQGIGIDKLLCFGQAFKLDPETLQIVPFGDDVPKYVMFGTVMQYMRFGSLIAVMAPFLLSKTKWYLIPIGIFCAFNQSSSFALALIAGVGSYLFFAHKKLRWAIVFGGIVLVGAYALCDWGSWRGAIIASNGGRLISWAYITKTWLFDLSFAKAGSLASMNGPFNLSWFLFGHGMDSFLTLFPLYKHDMNPFPQAHNEWLQMPWEIGIVGFSLFCAYCVSIIRKLSKYRLHLLLSGLVMLGVIRFFTFPDRMTQTMFLLVAFLAFCEQTIRKNELLPLSPADLNTTWPPLR